MAYSECFRKSLVLAAEVAGERGFLNPVYVKIFCGLVHVSGFLLFFKNSDFVCLNKRCIKVGGYVLRKKW